MNTLPELLSGKNINFLIGSGASMPLYPTLSLGQNMPTFEDLVSWPSLCEDNRRVLYYYYFKKWILPMKEYQNKMGEKEYCNVSSLYKKFINTILEILNHESNEKPKRANIFTTNYDLMFEIAFDEINKVNPICYFNDGSKGFINRSLNVANFNLNISHSGYHDNYKCEVPTINLFKIHGSVSWNKENDSIMVNYENNSFNNIPAIENLEICDIEQKIENTECILGTDIINSIDKKLKELTVDHKKLGEFYLEYRKLPIINPNKWKFHDTVYEQHYYQLIRSFSYEMEKKNTVLIVFAFSFADEHLFDIFKRSLLNPTLQVIMICFSKEEQLKLKDKFQGFNNIIYYPNECKKSGGAVLNGNFEFLINLLQGDIK